MNNITLLRLPKTDFDFMGKINSFENVIEKNILGKLFNAIHNFLFEGSFRNNVMVICSVDRTDALKIVFTKKQSRTCQV